MRSNTSVVAAALLLCATSASSCAPDTQPAGVEFGSTPAVGNWSSSVAGQKSNAAIGTPAAPAAKPTTSTNAVTTAAPMMVDAAGRSGAVVAQPVNKPNDTTMVARAGGSGGTSATPAAGSGSGSAKPPVAQAGNGSTQAEPASKVASLSFAVTTTANGGRYQPKNIGAIWVEDSSGKLVKSLEVWAASRRRYLTGYTKALGGGAVDVTASATLRSHQTHTVSWDLKDRTGAAVAPGAYRIKMELTDADSTGKSNAVDFDTSKGAVSMMPPDAPCFGAMKLELQ